MNWMMYHILLSKMLKAFSPDLCNLMASKSIIATGGQGWMHWCEITWTKAVIIINDRKLRVAKPTLQFATEKRTNSRTRPSEHLQKLTGIHRNKGQKRATRTPHQLLTIADNQQAFSTGSCPENFFHTTTHTEGHSDLLARPNPAKYKVRRKQKVPKPNILEPCSVWARCPGDPLGSWMQNTAVGCDL